MKPYTFDQTRNIHDLAADSAIRTIALYKAAGYTIKHFEDFPTYFWNSVPAAVPAERKVREPK